MRREDGFSLVEVLTAMVLLVGGALATFAVFDSSRAATGTAERVQAATALLQREMETIRTLDYTDIGIAGAPSTALAGARPTEPGAYNPTGSALEIQPSYQRPGAPVATENIVVGTLDPTADVSGQVAGGTLHRFVTNRTERCAFIAAVGETVQDGCNPGDVHSKRITLAVELGPVAGQGGQRNPVWLSSVIEEPDPAAGSIVAAVPAVPPVPQPEVNP